MKTKKKSLIRKDEAFLLSEIMVVLPLRQAAIKASTQAGGTARASKHTGRGNLMAATRAIKPVTTILALRI
jgi:hypothetical protein